MIQCEVGHQLVKSVEVQLTGYTPLSRDLKGHRGKFIHSKELSTCVFKSFAHVFVFVRARSVLIEDFRCQMLSDSEAEQSELRKHLSVTTEEAKRDPENSIIILTLRLVYTPLRTCRLLRYTCMNTSTCA